VPAPASIPGSPIRATVLPKARMPVTNGLSLRSSGKHHQVEDRFYSF
jgi:hypothetical protein